MTDADTIRSSIERVVAELTDFEPVRACRVDDDRGEAIIIVGAVDPPGCSVVTRPLSYGGAVSVWFIPKSAIGVVNTILRNISGQLSDLVLSYERALVRPPRKPGAA